MAFTWVVATICSHSSKSENSTRCWVEGASQSELAEIFVEEHLILTEKNNDLLLSVDRDGAITDDPKLIVNFARLRHVDIAEFDLERDLILAADHALLTI